LLLERLGLPPAGHVPHQADPAVAGEQRRAVGAEEGLPPRLRELPALPPARVGVDLPEVLAGGCLPEADAEGAVRERQGAAVGAEGEPAELPGPLPAAQGAAQLARGQVP